MIKVRSDLILDTPELVKPERGKGIEGLEVNEKKTKYSDVTIVDVKNDNGSKVTGKPVGRYITIDTRDISAGDCEIRAHVAEELATQLKIMYDWKGKTVLIVGLGNKNITPDSLGPKTVDKLMITRHINEYVPEHLDDGIIPVCAIAPGVLGTTGIESEEIVEGIVERVKPDAVIVIDSLASGSLNRINTTLQIADTGITPGSGVGNNRKGLNEQSLGVKVIAIGVPTVIDAAVIVDETINLISQEGEKHEKPGILGVIGQMEEAERQEFIRQILDPYSGGLIVTPRDIDHEMDNISHVIANALNMCLHRDITPETACKYIN
jgi:spore protease